MIHETKIAIVVRQDLAAWQKLNLTAFLAGGLAGARPELVGEPYRDAAGTGYLPLIRQPILVFAASGDDLARTLQRARDRGITPAIYPTVLFTTSNDADNRAAVAARPADALDLAGLALHAPRRDADKILKGLALHA